MAADGSGDVGPPLPEGAIACTEDSQCDDGVMCTRDECLERGYCANFADSTRCNDGVFCNGFERCHHVEGCVPGFEQTCDDDNSCTVDSCDEASKSCLHLPRDFDHDGEVDWHCLGGTDCDDFDPARGARVAEICSDSVDNDCDDQVDEEDCGRLPHDVCEDALQVDGEGIYLLNMAGALPDYGLACGAPDTPDVALRLSLSEPADVTITAEGFDIDEGREATVVAIRQDCAELASELDCASGVPGQVRTRALPSGDYFVLLSASDAHQIQVEIGLAEPTSAPENMTCESPLDVTGGGNFSGDFIDVSDDHQIGCGSGDSPDLVYRFTTESEQDVRITALGEEGERMSFAVRTDCQDETSALRCVATAPADGHLHRLPAGSYFLILEGSSHRENAFDLSISFEEPTDPPAGDSCDNAASLPLSTPVHGTLVGMQDLVTMSCGYFYRDMVYRFEVEKPIDIVAQVDGGDAYMDVAVSSDCGQEEGELFCIGGKPMGKRLRNVQAGTYYLLVESAEDTSFILQLEALPVTVPEPVSENDDCANAISIDPKGGLFSGETQEMTSDYSANCGGQARSRDATFKLELTEQMRVRAELDGEDFDPVLYRFLDIGEGPETCESFEDKACNDDGGPGHAAVLEEVLDAGIHYFIVDGFSMGNAGRYVLDVAVEEP